jgi:hypothetical protein
MADLYFRGRSGESYQDKPVHQDPDCPELWDGDTQGGIRPLADADRIDIDGQRCPLCFPDASIRQSNNNADSDDLTVEDIEQILIGGKCPWCDDYDGDHPKNHASSAHPDAWGDYKDSR